MAVAFREAVEAVGEHLQLARHAHPENQLFAAVRELAKWRAQPREALERLVDRALVAPVDEEAVYPDEELVAGRAFHRPRRQPLVQPENLFDDEVQPAIPGEPIRSNLPRPRRP